MDVDRLDKPLSDIIDEAKAQRRRGGAGGRGGSRGRGRGGRGGARGGRPEQVTSPTTVQVVVAPANGVGPVRNKYSGNIASSNAASKASAATAAAVPLMADGSKIIVSNLPQDVTENQVRVCDPYICASSGLL